VGNSCSNTLRNPRQRRTLAHTHRSNDRIHRRIPRITRPPRHVPRHPHDLRRLRRRPRSNQRTCRRIQQMAGRPRTQGNEHHPHRTRNVHQVTPGGHRQNEIQRNNRMERVAPQTRSRTIGSNSKAEVAVAAKDAGYESSSSATWTTGMNAPLEPTRVGTLAHCSIDTK